MARPEGAPQARRAALLFNPRAGQGRGARTLAGIVAVLRGAYRLDELPTDGPRHCKELARRAVEEGLDAVFVLGGDGTLRIAAGQLVGTGTALGPLPGGTTNVVASALGLPRDPVAAARALTTASVRELDVGRVHGPEGDGIFLMQLSGGLDARVMAAVDARWKRRFGKLAIAWTGLRELRRYSFPTYSLEVDGVTTTATGFVAANLAEYAGSFQIVPGAKADDQVLELLLFRGRRRRDALGFAIDLARGRHAARTDVEIRRVERVVLTGPRPLLLQGDGDPFEAEPPFEIRLSSRRLRVLAPTPARGLAKDGAR
jgi:diacylglycerol kinase family enzyme